MDSTALDYAKQMVRISDAAAMMRMKPNNAMSQYKIDVINMNNKLVDRWEREVLENIANNEGMVRASQIWDSWKIFLEGVSARTLFENYDQFTNLTDEQITFWKAFLELDIEVLHTYGSGAVYQGKQNIETEVRRRITKEKWDKVYSKTDDPKIWYNEAKVYNDLFFNDDNEFYVWSPVVYKELLTKIHTIIDNPVKPEKVPETLSLSFIKPYLKKPVHNYFSPYVKKITTQNNHLVDNFYSAMIDTNYEKIRRDLCDGGENIKFDDLWELWYIYNEGINTKEMNEFFKYYISLSPEQISYWRDLFLKPIEELHNMGSGYIYKAWVMIEDHVRIYFARTKYEHIYSKYDNPYDWYQHRNDVNYNHPIWSDKEVYMDVYNKAMTIIQTPVTPEN